MAQAPAAWLKFLTTLESQGVSFEDIQFTDSKSREELIGEITADFSKLERAVVTSHWNKLNTLGSSSASNSAAAASGMLTSANNIDLASQLTSPSSVSHLHHHQQRQLLPQHPSGSAVIIPSQQLQQQQQVQQQQQQQQLFPVPGSKETQSIGNYLVSADGVSYGQNAGPFDPTQLRASLSRGDATCALPLASEMLQKDPLALCSLLHDYAPHLSVATIKSILGLDGGPPGRGLPPAIHATTSDQSPLRFGSFEGNDIGGNVVVSGSNTSNKSRRDADATIALVNGQQVPVGQVLTNVGLSAIYGQGFSITCNGQLVHLPYCVQPGDRILVTAAEVRI